MDHPCYQHPVPAGLEDLLADHFTYLDTKSQSVGGRTNSLDSEYRERERTHTMASTYTARSTNTFDTDNTFDSYTPLRPMPVPIQPSFGEENPSNPVGASQSSATTLIQPPPGSHNEAPKLHKDQQKHKQRRSSYVVHAHQENTQSSGSSISSTPNVPALPSSPNLAATRDMKSSKRTSNRSFLAHEKNPSDPESSVVEEKMGFSDVESSSTPPDQQLPHGDHAPLKIGLAHEICFIAIVACSHLMTQAALGQALGPLATIGETFGTTSLGEMTWFIASYSLTVGTFILVSGRIGDILGHKKVFVFGYAWLGMWAAFSGFAAYTGRATFFDVCRAMQGIGPALLMPNGLALFGRAYPMGIKKNIVFSIFGAVAPLGFVIGSCSGSVFSEYLWWPWSFWSYGITAFCLGTFALLVIPATVGSPIPNPPSFDYKGAVSGVAGLVLFNVAWNLAPLDGWSSPHVYFLLIIGILILAFFFYIETKVKDPLLPLKVLDSSTGFVLACVGLGWGAFSVWLFYTYRFLMDERLHSPLSVTGQFAPAALTGMMAAGLTGFLLTHTPVSFTMMISMMAFFIGTCIGGTAPVGQTYWAQTFISIFIMPFGMDMSFPAATVILSNHMPREHQGLAASLVNTVVNYGIATALGIAGTVEINVSKNGTDTTAGIRSGFYTAMGMSGLAVLVGMTYFVKTLRKEGWKVMDH